MDIFKKITGKGYRHARAYYDSLMRFMDRSSKTPKALVLLYHRVSRIDHDPLMLNVSPENFEEHLILLKQQFEIINVDELLKRYESKKLCGNELCITFDDGYKDNYTEALPIARKYDVPITIFISTSILEKSEPFSWDILYKNKNSYLTRDDIISLASDPLVTIGGHTINHPRLRGLPLEVQYTELTESKFLLENIIGKPIMYMAYPFGGFLDYDKNTIHMLQKTGYRAAFTTTERAINISSNKLKLPRVNIRNYNGKKLTNKLANYKKI